LVESVFGPRVSGNFKVIAMREQKSSKHLINKIEHAYQYFGNSPQQREMNFSHVVAAFLLIVAGLLYHFLQ
jgi:hypothetical protein